MLTLECIIEMCNGCRNNPKYSITTKVSKHNPSVFSISTISTFMSIENKHGVCRGKNCMKTFYEYLRENSMKVAKQDSHENAQIYYICKEKFENKHLKHKKIW